MTESTLATKNVYLNDISFCCWSRIFSMVN